MITSHNKSLFFLILFICLLESTLIVNTDIVTFTSIWIFIGIPITFIVNLVLIIMLLKYSVKKNYISLALLSLTLLLFMGYDPIKNYYFNVDYSSRNFLNLTDYYKPSILLTLSIISIFFGYKYFNIRSNKKKYSLNHRLEKSEIHLAFLISVIGFIAIFIKVYISGGFISVWSRSQPVIPWAGILSSFSFLALIYPFYIYLSDRKNNTQIIISVFIIILYFLYAMFSGKSTHHIVLFIPFLVVYIVKSGLSLKRILFIIIAITLILGSLRFSRFMGGRLIDFNNNKLTGIQRAFLMSRLNPLHSFVQFPYFAMVVKLTDERRYYLWGKTYLLSFVSVIPGKLWPEKQRIINEYRVDRFLPYGLYGVKYNPNALWPSGFYGESYLNFGWIGILLSSFFIGILCKVSDFLILRNKRIFGIPDLWFGSTLISNLILFCRMNSIEFGNSFFIPVIILIVFTRVFHPQLRG